MDRKHITKHAPLLLLSLCTVFLLSGCRTRTTVSDRGKDKIASASGTAAAEIQGELPGDIFSQPQIMDADALEGGEPGSQARENPEAARKEYDENAPAEVIEGTNRFLHAEGEGNGTPHIADDAEKSAALLNDLAAEPATQKIAAQEAEQMGVSEDAEAADSALTYYTVLLQERMGSLFECQRANVYWETAQDHLTIHRSSREHVLLTDAGLYDVSARLLPENLLVDDGWIIRKNPQVIVKIVNEDVLGSSVNSSRAAKSVYQALLSRPDWTGIDAVKNRRVIVLSQELLSASYLQTAAMLAIAQASAPTLFSDVDAEQALQQLAEEATGSIPDGIWFYTSKEERNE
ncbi:MAG: hypothetical protein IJ157_11665 [Clostridia bacterium]|nr:hypothetical protein [Clostridia bacterium]